MKNKDTKAFSEHIIKTLEATIAAYLKQEVVVRITSHELVLDTINAEMGVQSVSLRVMVHMEPRTSPLAISAE